MKNVCCAALCRNRTLVSIELGSNELTDKSGHLLGDCLKFNFKLEGLSLWQNEVGPGGAQSIASGLQANKSLLWLGLGSNQVGVEGAWALSEALQTNSSLLWLGLGGNGISDRGALHLSALLQGQLVVGIHHRIHLALHLQHLLMPNMVNQQSMQAICAVYNHWALGEMRFMMKVRHILHWL